MSGVGALSLRLPALPPRSRLYHLTPRGLGTPLVESVASYLMRLSAAHGVTPGALVTYELLPELHRPAVAARPAATWLQRDGAGLNGTGSAACATVAALERLTRQADLASLTLLPWAAALAPPGLLRRTRAWCPACIAGWVAAGEPVYEPLLWAMAAVRVCPQHRRRLDECCPYPDCRRRSPTITARAHAGYCAACRRGVDGAGGEPPPPLLTADEWAWQQWVVEMVGPLLAAAPPHEGLRGGPQFARALEAERLRLTGGAAGSIAAFSRALGVRPNLLLSWRSGQVLPTLDRLLRVCARRNTTPVRLLTGEGGTPAPDSIPPPPTAQPPRRAVAQPRGPVETERMRQALEAALASSAQPPASVHRIMRQLGCTNWIYKRFPDLCRALTARYTAYQVARKAGRYEALEQDIRQAIAQLAGQNRYPSSKRILALLARPVHPKSAAFTCARQRLLQEIALGSAAGPVVIPSLDVLH